MVLLAVVGELGAGKTLTLTYLAIKQHLERGRKIYSNYRLYGVPYFHVDSIPDIESMSQGFVALDEMWLWIDARCSLQQKNRVTSSILLKSRKRGLTIAYTTQSFDQVDKRVRKITDFMAYPILSVGNSYCKVVIFRGSHPTVGGIIQKIYFRPEIVYQAFNSQEEIQPLKVDDAEPMKEFIFPLEENPVLGKDVQ